MRLESLEVWSLCHFFSILRPLKLIIFLVYKNNYLFSSQGQNDAHHVSYKRFRRRITQRSSSEGPAASTPLATGRQCEPSFELDTVCQRLELDSPPRHHEPAQRVLQGNLRGIARVNNTPRQRGMWKKARNYHTHTHTKHPKRSNATSSILQSVKNDPNSAAEVQERKEET